MDDINTEEIKKDIEEIEDKDGELWGVEFTEKVAYILSILNY